MARYIDADRLKDAFHTDTEHLQSRDEHLFDLIMFEIDETPTADVAEVKHGEWEKRQKLYGVGVEYVCSVCEKGIRQYEGQPICSECGAKMDGGKKE